MRRRVVSLAILIALLVVPVLFAQVAGRIVGSVVDQTGSAVPNAKVNLLLPGGSAPVISTVTTAEGSFVIPTVRPDFYDLQIEAAGFTKATLTRVKVDPSKETAIPPIRLLSLIHISLAGGVAGRKPSPFRMSRRRPAARWNP